MTRPNAISVVIEQHGEELAALWSTRQALTRAGHVALRHLARIDQRIAAHQDGCVVAGAAALAVLNAQLATATAGRLFAAAAVGFDLNDRPTVARCVALAEAVPDARTGLISALGWVPPDRLRGIVKEMMTASSSVLRAVGLAACRVHGVSPGSALIDGLEHLDPEVRAEAFRTAGVIGEVDYATAFGELVDRDPTCRFWSSWSAVLLGHRGRGLDALTETAVTDGIHRLRAFHLSCQALRLTAAHDLLSRLSSDPAQKPYVIEGAGVVGDPVYVPWLISHMADDKLARLAGSAFESITGADLALLDLERKPPEALESGPNDNPDDLSVAIDGDEGLPWPDPARVRSWWDANQKRFRAGVRYLKGAPVSSEQCLEVLKNGSQRERRLAAQQIPVLSPGSALFNTSAPASRQESRLAEM
jgi:uncharacterized protein (TIGR02270 family)